MRNEEIENQLKRDKMLQRNEIKMLLLGLSTPFITLPAPLCVRRISLTITQELVSLESPPSSSR